MSSLVTPPLLSVAIEPNSGADQEKLSAALKRIADEDPSFQFEISEETGQTILKGMDELHLENKINLLRESEDKPAFCVGAPQVAYRETITAEGKKILLEPIMKVEVVTPQEYAEEIIADIKPRRGKIDAQEVNDSAVVIRATVPFASMFGYVNTLRAMSQGEAQYTMQFDCYAPVPGSFDDDPTFRPAMAMRA